jgi:photosystem II stability/assembly factor-like uncharacterized protein
VAFGSATVGIAISGSDVARTEDAGATWQTVSNAWFGYQYNAVAFASPATVVATLHSSNLARSTDGGVTWTLIDDGTLDIDAASVKFTTALEGIAVGSYGRLARTHDGGASWISESSQRWEWFTGVAYTPSGVPFAIAGGNVYRGNAAPQ